MHQDTVNKIKQLSNSQVNLASLLTDRFPLAIDGEKTRRAYRAIESIGAGLADNPYYVGVVVSGSRAQGVPSPHSDVDISVLVTSDYPQDSNLINELLRKVSSKGQIKTIIDDLYGGILDKAIDDKQAFLNHKIAVRMDKELIAERMQKLADNDFLTTLDGRYSLFTSFGNIVHFSQNKESTLVAYRTGVIEHLKKQPELLPLARQAYEQLFIGVIEPLRGLDAEYKSRMYRLLDLGFTADEVMQILQYRVENFSITKYFPEFAA